MESQQQIRSTYQSPLNSPSSSTSINQTPQGHHHLTQTPPLTPNKTITSTRSDPSIPYPTTFVQADTTSFKQVVQMLTGSSSDPTSTTSSNSNFTFTKSSIPPIKNHHQQKKQQPSSKLYERRNQLRNNLMINTLVSNTLITKTATITTNLSPRHHQAEMILLSPSMLDFPKLVLSPVTPLMEDIFNNCNNKSLLSTPSTANSILSEEEEEDKAIAEKGFYFHPSPRTNSSTMPKGGDQPQLLPLFPVTTPHRVSGTS